MNKLLCFLLLFLSVSNTTQGSNVNYARNTDRIWLDSKEVHQGEYVWKMKKVDEVKASAGEVSSLGYNTSDWLSAVVPGTVLNSLVYNEKYPEPYYGLLSFGINGSTCSMMWYITSAGSPTASPPMA